MTPTSSVHSQTLHSITHTKLNELAKKRAAFERQQIQINATVEQESNAIKKVEALVEGLKACFPIATSNGRVVRGASNSPRMEIDVKNFDRFLAQARCDPSVSSDALRQWQRTLVRHYEVQGLKYEYASLYGQLTTAWLAEKGTNQTAGQGGDVNMEDFEQVSSGKKLESRIQWEQAAFEPVVTDQKALVDMLRGLFESTPDDSKHLLKAVETLRTKVKDFERDLASQENFNARTLEWIIIGLLDSDLLDDEKRNVLRDFKDNDTVLSEIADVLNMRMAALKDWSWGVEVLLEERRQLNGTYNIFMQEDLLEAIFLQYVGVRWSVFWKKTFNSFRRVSGVWKSSQAQTSTLDRKRRDYYLGGVPSGYSVDSKRLAIYRNGYFVSQLLDHKEQNSYHEEGEEEADFEEHVLHVQQAAPTKRGRQGPPRRQLANKAARKQAPSGPTDHEAMEDGGGQYKPKNAMDAKQKILHLLSAEIIIKTWLHGEVTCFRSQVDSLYPSLPHSTVESVMSFFGVSEVWLRFFNRFLKAPLRFEDDTSSKPCERKNGTPGSHVLSEVVSEVVLFCLDFQINQETGGQFLWRRNDDFWFWSSDHTVSEKAWSTVQRFMKMTGLKLNQARSGAVRIAARKTASAYRLSSLDVGNALPKGQIRWGMLYLDPNLGRFEIDQEMVDKHIYELSRQLRDKAGSIFPWIQAWNSYASTFFTSNFGTPANCFGRQHVDNMLATHQRIQQQIFDSSANPSSIGSKDSHGSVIEYLKSTIKQRFGTEDIPDGYFYFPTDLGGLEVRNPFIGLLQIRDAVHEDPLRLLRGFEEEEKEAYRSAREAFETGRISRPGPDTDFKPEHPDNFFSFAEYTRYREALPFGYSGELVDVFSTLLEEPEEESIETDDNGSIKTALNSIGSQHGSGGITSNWYSMKPYWKWVAQLYGPEMITKFGGLSIVDPCLLPLGMVSLFRSGRISWQD